jgi:RNA polymerase sigma factor (TIGR02999 family)
MDSPALPHEHGDAEIGRQLFAFLYEELRRIAGRELRQYGSFLTLDATTLLHEVYLNLQKRHTVAFPDHAHFLAYASRAMRGLIIDHARSQQTLKRGGAFELTSLPAETPEHAADPERLERLGDAVERLAAVEPRLAQIIDLKYFSGFSFIEIATMWGVSARTIQRDWMKARLFLQRALSAAD